MFLYHLLLKIQYMLLISSILCVSQYPPWGEKIPKCDLDDDFKNAYIGLVLSPLEVQHNVHELRVIWENEDFAVGDQISVFSYRSETGFHEIYNFVPSHGSGWRDTGIEADFDELHDFWVFKQCLTYYVAWIRHGIIHSINCIKTEPSWMADREKLLGSLTFNDLFIPGTHDSASYRVDSSHSVLGKILRRFVVTQDLNILHQLIFGARYLDLRVGYYPDDHVTPWWANHGRVRMVPLIQVIEQVKLFLEQTREFVILDLQEFPVGFDSEYSDNIYKNLLSYLRRELRDHLAPISFDWKTPLSTLWSNPLRGRLFLNFDLSAKKHLLLARQESTRQFWSDSDDLEELHTHLARIETQITPNAETLKVSMAELTLNPLSLKFYFSNGIRSLAESSNSQITLWYHTKWCFSANIVAVDFLRSTGIVDIAIKANHLKASKYILKQRKCFYSALPLSSVSLLEFMDRKDVQDLLVPRIVTDAVSRMYQIMVDNNLIDSVNKSRKAHLFD